MDSWEVSQGEPLTIAITARDASGNAVAFTGAEALASVLWAGGSQPALATPIPTWVTAASGLLSVTLTTSQTASLDVGTYQLKVYLSDTSQPLYLAAITVRASAGSATSLPVYCDYGLVSELAPWVEACFDPKRHLAGFLRERARARQRFDELVLRSYRGNALGQFGSHSWSAMQLVAIGYRRSLAPSKILSDYLAANKLVLTEKVLRINAAYAIYEIGRQQIGRQNVYAAYGQAAADDAAAEVSSCVAYLDTNGDGYYEYSIPLGTSNTLFT